MSQLGISQNFSSGTLQKNFVYPRIINANELFVKSKRQNILLPEHIEKIVETYQFRKEVKEELANGSLYVSRRVSIEEIEENNFNLNISRYVSTAKPEPEVDLAQVYNELTELTGKISEATQEHNRFLKELGLPELP